MKLAELDPNFAVKTDVEADLVFFQPLHAPFILHGVLPPRPDQPLYHRMPVEEAARVSDGVRYLCNNTAGGRLRFRTDSGRVAIRTRQRGSGRMPHMTLICGGGFDLYADGEDGAQRCYGVFKPPYDLQDGYESTVAFPDRRERTVTIHFPLYGCVTDLQIGLDRDATLSEPAPYALSRPVLYYGSSITQGGCASRPGGAYTAMLTRALNVDHVNLGFSGSAKGEPIMAEYIARQEMSAFVMDYDYNASTPEDLAATHYPFYETVRKTQPKLPILLVSSPVVHPDKTARARRDVVAETYRRAKAVGDKRIWFLDGSTMFPAGAGEECLVDLCHPNDLGFFFMAEAMKPYLKEMLNL